MTLDEKLDNFYHTAMEDATNRSIAIINKYRHSLDEIFEEHKKESLRKANLAIEIENKNLNREKNKAISTQILKYKRIINDKSKELTDSLFADVLKKLEDYMKTDDYISLLEQQVLFAKNFSKNEPITIYINPSDKDKLELLEFKTGTSLTLSTINFLGGIRAVIHSKNILIDKSFATQLKENKEKFVL